MKEDAGKLYNIAVKLCSNLSLDECLVDEKHAVEMTRYGGCELHNIASFLGGEFLSDITDRSESPGSGVTSEISVYAAETEDIPWK